MNENEILTTEEEPVAQDPEIVTETFESVIVESDRPFLSTPLDDYTVTEGLLLIIALILVLRWIGQAIKEGFYWLW